MKSLKTRILKLIVNNKELKQEIAKELGSGYDIWYCIDDEDDAGYAVELVSILNGERG